MKTKYIWWTVFLAAVLALSWFCWTTWKGQNGIVSLKVRNVPVAVAVKKLESQTGLHISVDKQLTGLVTLNVKNKSLPEVLDRIGKQAGARWSTVYAVYASDRALQPLESALRGEQKLEDAGWRQLAPALDAGPPMDMNLPDGAQVATRSIINKGGDPVSGGPDAAGGQPRRVIVTRGPGPGGGTATTVDEDVQVKAGDGPGGKRQVVVNAGGPDGASLPPGGHAMMMRSSGEPGSSVYRVFTKGANGEAIQEVWSPFELVMESKLDSNLSSDYSPEPTPQAAAELAKKVKGRWKTYYAMTKTAMGMNLTGLPGMNFGGRKMMAGGGKEIQFNAGTNVNGATLNMEQLTSNLEETVRKQKLEDLAKLTPEQRVQRARERAAMQKQ
jgi:hypothetical protein